MKLFHAKLEDCSAQLRAESNGGFTVVTRSGFQIPLAPYPDREPESAVSMPVPRWAVEHSINALVTLDDQIISINADQRLSPLGRKEKLAEPKFHAVRMTAMVHKSMADHEQKLLAAEVERYRVGPVDHSNVAMALRDFEIRTSVRGMSPDERARLLHRLGDGEDSDLLLAVLRSPLPTSDLETTARNGWTKLIDTRDPAGRSAIDAGKASVAWAKQAFGHIVGNLNRLHGFERRELYEHVREYGAHQLFGIPAHDVSTFERLREHGR